MSLQTVQRTQMNIGNAWQDQISEDRRNIDKTIKWCERAAATVTREPIPL